VKDYIIGKKHFDKKNTYILSTYFTFLTTSKYFEYFKDYIKYNDFITYLRCNWNASYPKFEYSIVQHINLSGNNIDTNFDGFFGYTYLKTLNIKNSKINKIYNCPYLNVIYINENQKIKVDVHLHQKIELGLLKIIVIK
jgi:hypothetical protein